ncbi:hypothetical protein DCC81_10205 [Chitinophaga parva]|uniref:Lipocalin-like domain-containing protein n=1 Tax=Chitinophaga parva TaxID=2169414 RepID=A0A2T7BEJ3_9BACT|nr:hypothetical protein [Chitinophaga parva]PUZ24712.1 hypothetical protein DCC81_10205 [Chitinophaga parva]
MTSKQITFTALVGLAVLFGCKKDDAPHVPIDISKFVDKQWYLDGVTDSVNNTDMFRTIFSGDHSGSYSYCTWIVAPYQYGQVEWTWERQGEDTIVINGGYKLKIRSVNDSVLVTNGLGISTGIEPGVPDTTSVRFRSF